MRHIRQRFGDEVDAHVEKRVAAASFEQLETWTARVLSAATLTDLLGDGPEAAGAPIQLRRYSTCSPSAS